MSVLEDGDVRVGWSTNDASLMLGMDSNGYGYGAAENGNHSPNTVSPLDLSKCVIKRGLYVCNVLALSRFQAENQ